jgi:hypothetical protein
MEHALELRDLMLRFYAAVSVGDVDFLEQFLSNQGDVLMFGTDPRDWWVTPTDMRQGLKAQAGAGIRTIDGDPQAYREGTVGWVVDRPKFNLPNETQIPMRWTGVFHQESGEWKLIQGHASCGVHNEAAAKQS